MARTDTIGGGRYALGQYRDLVDVQAPIAGGGWRTLNTAALWARVAPVSTFQRLQAAQLQAAIDYRVTIPGCAFVIDETMRILWRTAPVGSTITLQMAAKPIVDPVETVCECVEAHA